LFEEELAWVQAHNADETQTWKAGINKFSALTKEEKRTTAGMMKKSSAHMSKPLRPVTHEELQQTSRGAPSRPKLLDQNHLDRNMRALASSNSTITGLPTSVDWRNAGIISTVRDQGSCGSCWAFASAGIVEAYAAMNTGILYQLSTQQFVSCVNNTQDCGGTGGCTGGTDEIAFEYMITTKALYSDDQYPYNSYYPGVDKPTCQYPPSCSVVNCDPAISIQDYANVPSNDYQAVSFS
jgi:cathepsin L